MLRTLGTSTSALPEIRPACSRAFASEGLVIHTTGKCTVNKLPEEHATLLPHSDIAMASKLTLTEAEELQKQGQDLFRQKKYQAALQRFNAVCTPPHKISFRSLTSSRYSSKTANHHSQLLIAVRPLEQNSLISKPLSGMGDA